MCRNIDILYVLCQHSTMQCVKSTGRGDYTTDLEIQIQELKQMRMQMGVNRKEFTDYFGIPIRTVEDWEAGKRRMPVYDDKGELIRYNIFKM